MFNQMTRSANRARVGTVRLPSRDGQERTIGDVFASDSGTCEVVLPDSPAPGWGGQIRFSTKMKPGRRALATLIETGFGDVRMEIGQVEIGSDGSGRISVFGKAGFSGRLVF